MCVCVLCVVCGVGLYVPERLCVCVGGRVCVCCVGGWAGVCLAVCV